VVKTGFHPASQSWHAVKAGFGNGSGDAGTTRAAPAEDRHYPRSQFAFAYA
jgi:hypothetical protein